MTGSIFGNDRQFDRQCHAVSDVMTCSIAVAILRQCPFFGLTSVQVPSFCNANKANNRHHPGIKGMQQLSGCSAERDDGSRQHVFAVSATAGALNVDTASLEVCSRRANAKRRAVIVCHDLYVLE